MNRSTTIGFSDDWLIAPSGIWLEARSQPSTEPRPDPFLDRNGVIVVDKGFLAVGRLLDRDRSRGSPEPS